MEVAEALLAPLARRDCREAALEGADITVLSRVTGGRLGLGSGTRWRLVGLSLFADAQRAGPRCSSQSHRLTAVVCRCEPPGNPRGASAAPRCGRDCFAGLLTRLMQSIIHSTASTCPITSVAVTRSEITVKMNSSATNYDRLRDGAGRMVDPKRII